MSDFILKNLGFILAGLFLWLVGLTFVLYNLVQSLNSLVKGVKSGNLVEVLKQILVNTKQNSKQLTKLGTDLESLAKDSKGHLQKVSLLRFNPFSDTGGDQSFVVTLLDGEDSGLIISSLHSRAGTRMYAKPVDKGKPRDDVKLSQDEERGLKVAISAR